MELMMMMTLIMAAMLMMRIMKLKLKIFKLRLVHTLYIKSQNEKSNGYDMLNKSSSEHRCSELE